MPPGEHAALADPAGPTPQERLLLPRLARAATLSAAPLSAAEHALLHAYELKRDLQDGRSVTSEDVERLIAEADAAGYAEAVRAGLLLDIVRDFCETSVWPCVSGIERLLERAAADGSTTGTALALALRGQLPAQQEDTGSLGGPDDDLTRASVMLEGLEGPSIERASAHLECARGYLNRGLWELELRHYEAAEAALVGCAGAQFVMPAILFNRAETLMNWCTFLRERGPCELPADRVASARAALDEADVDLVPASWRTELRIFGALLDAIVDPALTPVPSEPDPDHEYAGHVHLTRALIACDREHGSREVATREIGLALERIDPNEASHAHRLALCIAAEIEAEGLGRPGAGLHYARVLVEMRWQTRLAGLAAMRSRLDVERMREEHARLDRHAHLDELTGLANRRALGRYVEDLTERGVDQVSFAVLDLDCFKGVNDRYGHHVGDEMLRHVARILRGSIREQDIAVRLGGDEFLLVMPHLSPEIAHRRGTEVVAAIATADWGQIAAGLAVTSSLGLAAGHPRQAQDLIVAADAALYRAKAAGGNRVLR
ncbi:MAG TPA: GGDEF domain-containing protein [Solirubrobacteraceae bacterium]|nr:GGDEF domain-containing protein [Solirubrobacteraceae bacterium]